MSNFLCGKSSKSINLTTCKFKSNTCFYSSSSNFHHTTRHFSRKPVLSFGFRFIINLNSSSFSIHFFLLKCSGLRFICISNTKFCFVLFKGFLNLFCCCFWKPFHNSIFILSNKEFHFIWIFISKVRFSSHLLIKPHQFRLGSSISLNCHCCCLICFIFNHLFVTN